MTREHRDIERCCEVSASRPEKLAKAAPLDPRAGRRCRKTESALCFSLWCFQDHEAGEAALAALTAGDASAFQKALLALKDSQGCAAVLLLHFRCQCGARRVWCGWAM